MAIKEKLSDRLKKEKRIYTPAELEQFDKSVQKYRKDVTLTTGEVVNILDWDTIYFKAGVKTKEGAVTWYMVGDQKIFHIEEFDNKRDQWERWKYGKEKQMEQYQATAEKSPADKDFDNW